MSTPIKIVIIAAVAVFVLAGLGRRQATAPAQSGGATATLAASADSIALSEESFDFGSISMADGIVRHAFTVTNNGSSTIPLRELVTSCMCTEAWLTLPEGERMGPFGMAGHGGFARPLVAELAPGAIATLDVAFDPAAHGPAGVGPIDRLVRLANDSGVVAEVGISAVVTP